MRPIALLCLCLVLAGCREIVTTTPSPPSAGMTLTATPSLSGMTPTTPAQANRSRTTTPTPAEDFDPAGEPSPVAGQQRWHYSYPIGAPGRPLGDGFFIRHGYAVENTWFAPGNWHTGEDWYSLEADTAGSLVYAAGDGEVVFVGADYPGRVVIVKHGHESFSMYGHLDPNLEVHEGQQLARGDMIGRVFNRRDSVPSHLHFEIRTFLTKDIVNGDSPRYSYNCSVRCPPGPGYWPIGAPNHPGAIGWHNPTHFINRHLAESEAGSEVVVATQPASSTVTLWNRPPGENERQRALGQLALAPGQRYQLLDISTGPPDSAATSALGYQLWYHIALPDGREAWAEAIVPSPEETGSDGRPASLRFNFFPAIPTPNPAEGL
ncbi:MAG: hypothetical protein KatS3mg057_0532 [Herpetosiphonaceae bacterium]|nr:MAG: hypothetical protein KatS3mg057_0532 [Herpetosiphonaceae bacterium]